MDDRVPERRDSHASSSHEPSLESNFSLENQAYEKCGFGCKNTFGVETHLQGGSERPKLR